MTPIADNAAFTETTTLGRRNRATQLCLVVHDDLELRLKLASLVRRSAVKLDADTITRAGFDALSVERLRSYAAVLLIVEFMRREIGHDPLAIVTHLRAQAPRLPIFVFARHGDERWAARAIKAGAADYWPIHAVNVGEFTVALQPLLATTANTPAATLPASAAPAPIPPTVTTVATMPPAAPVRAASAMPDHSMPAVAGYRLLKKIAHSSGATVYLARNEKLGQQVALKVQPIKGHASVSEEDRRDFARECEILASLNHRSIADVIDFGITPEYLYLALEYFPCGSMRERLKNPVSEADAVNYARQIAEALQVVHAAGVVHRDLKPSNIMLTTDNRVVLIDFGSARGQLVDNELSRSDLQTGTPYYVCPEQIAGNHPDQRADIYSLGIVFYEMLAGSLPFRGNTLADILNAHRNAAAPPLPAPLARYQPLVDRLLAKNPNDRYPSAGHFLEALRDAGGSAALRTGHAGLTGAFLT
ncbi:MAG: serine/threonine-protein kinase [Steroidobacteraceae bacterium]|jgi:tRNA A-37 threonylcarbamoyl transferase component Bud32/ActR/RegA family two-component response regulator